MVHHNVCPLCSSDKTGLLLKCNDHFVSGEEFTLFKCRECNFIFTQDYPEEDEIGRYYESEDYISHSDTSKGFSNKLYRLARSFMLRRKRNLIIKTTTRDFLQHFGRILNTGTRYNFSFQLPDKNR